MVGSTIPVSIIGIRFAMSVQPFWSPEQYSKHIHARLSHHIADNDLKSLWLACCVEQRSLASSWLPTTFSKSSSKLIEHFLPMSKANLFTSENRDKVETYLAFGASRFEACKPIATDALRLALTPNINQMRCAPLQPLSDGVDSSSSQRSRDHCHPWHDDRGYPWRLLCAAGCPSTDGYHVYDLLLHRALVDRDHNPRVECRRRPGAPRPDG